MGDLISLTRFHALGVFLDMTRFVILGDSARMTRSGYLVCILVSDSFCNPWVTPLVLTRSMLLGD